MRAPPFILLIAMTAAGAVFAKPTPTAPPRTPLRGADPIAAAASRGHTVAIRLCARCHAVEAAGASPDARAPTFRELTGQFTSLTLQRRLTEIAETGHYDMPPVSAHADEVADLVAYINGFGDAWRRDDRRDLPR
jgi:mono/diheme cytochrome c family protein